MNRANYNIKTFQLSLMIIMGESFWKQALFLFHLFYLFIYLFF